MLIVGFLLASLNQGVARGSVDLAKLPAVNPSAVTFTAPVILPVESGVEADACCSEPKIADTKPSFCNSDMCKAVMSPQSETRPLTGQDRDGFLINQRQSVSVRVEPHPPKS